MKKFTLADIHRVEHLNHPMTNSRLPDENYSSADTVIPVISDCAVVLDSPWLYRRAQMALYLESSSLKLTCNTRMRPDVAPNFYPAAIGVWPSVVPGWAVMAAVRGAEPSVERSAADRRS